MLTRALRIASGAAYEIRDDELLRRQELGSAHTRALRTALSGSSRVIRAIRTGGGRASPAIQGGPLETCVDMSITPPYPPGAPCPGLFQSYMEHRVFDIVLFEIFQGREIPSNPNISQRHGGAPSSGNSTMMKFPGGKTTTKK